MGKSKLEDALGKPVQAPEEVTHLMAQVRKELERLNLKKQYTDLVFFCDWALHPQLDRKEAQTVVKEFNDAAPGIVRTQTAAGLSPHLRGIVSLDLLRAELRTFLQARQLPLTLVDDGGWWATFNLFYIDAVTGSPLKLANGYEVTVKHSNTRFIPLKPMPHRETVMVSEWILSLNGSALATLYNEGYRQTERVTLRQDKPGGPVIKTIELL